MTCPKCGSDMRRYERNGVDIDQCTECRGIFLDRGELERLVDAETGYYGGERTAKEPSRGGGGEHRGDGHKGRRKKSSFLSELFE
jgi:Zn-finger nucleic acid-binding protein